MSSSNTLASKFKAHYDKGIAALVMVLLLISLVYLVWKVGSTRKLQQETIERVTGLTPDNEFAKEVDTSRHDRALELLTSPAQLDASGWTNRMLFVPESRVTCAACGAPRPYVMDAVCPWSWCDYRITEKRAVETVDEDKDTDGDGMLDEWEIKYALNREDPADAAEDGDKDTFSNLEEFKASPKTDPTDQKSRPSFFPAHVAVIDIEAQSFQMVFSSKTKNIRDEYSFGLNYRSGGEVVTKFVKLGESFAGFKIAAFDEKFVEVGDSYSRKEDRSELTLEKGRLKVVLVFKKRSTDVDRMAVLGIPRISVGGKVKTFDPVREGDRIVIDRHPCLVSRIDMDRRVVVLIRERDGKAFTISEQSKQPQVSPRFPTGT
jgi:hypothetical protein